MPEHSKSFLCEVTTIDSYCQEKSIERVDFIKLDIEGAELLALRGGVETIVRSRPIVVVEVNFETSAAFGYEPGDIISWFAKFDYSCYVMRKRKWFKALSGSELEHGTNMLFVWNQDIRRLRKIDHLN